MKDMKEKKLRLQAIGFWGFRDSGATLCASVFICIFLWLNGLSTTKVTNGTKRYICSGRIFFVFFVVNSCRLELFRETAFRIRSCIGFVEYSSAWWLTYHFLVFYHAFLRSIGINAFLHAALNNNKIYYDYRWLCKIGDISQRSEMSLCQMMSIFYELRCIIWEIIFPNSFSWRKNTNRPWINKHRAERQGTA